MKKGTHELIIRTDPHGNISCHEVEFIDDGIYKEYDVTTNYMDALIRAKLGE